jgi:hypothetical protein
LLDPIRSVEENLVNIIIIRKKRNMLLMKNDRILLRELFSVLMKTAESFDDSPEDAQHQNSFWSTHPPEF